MTGWPLRCWEGLCKRLQSNRVEDFYQLDTALGSGAFCTVYLATCKKTYDKAAVKLFKRTSASQDVNGAREAFETERNMLESVRHPNVIELLNWFLDESAWHLVVEVCSGGELLDKVVEAGSLTERQASILMKQICDPLAFLHQQHVCHRDLKPEHFLFARPGPLEEVPLKIIDFGLACRFEEGQILNDSPGTVMYVAPEILTANYQPPACDLWSYGVVAYLTMSGISPFDADTAKQVARNVKKANYNFDDPCWGHVSEEGKDFLRRLLQKDVQLRLTAEGAQMHRWISEAAPSAKAEALPMMDQLDKWIKDNRRSRELYKVYFPGQ